jgi:hypothetical protein
MKWVICDHELRKCDTDPTLGAIGRKPVIKPQSFFFFFFWFCFSLASMKETKYAILLVFVDWLISLNNIISSSFHFPIKGIISFFLMVEYNSIV